MALAHLVFVDVAATGPRGAAADATGGGCRTYSAALATQNGVSLAIKVAGGWRGSDSGGKVSEWSWVAGSSDTFKAGKTRDAVCALGIESIGSRVVRMKRVRQVASVTVLNSYSLASCVSDGYDTLDFVAISR